MRRARLVTLSCDCKMLQYVCKFSVVTIIDFLAACITVLFFFCLVLDIYQFFTLTRYLWCNPCVD
jgi:hypothetical protein